MDLKTIGFRDMPTHFFPGALDFDDSTAIPANVDAQDYTVMPRTWYVDVRFPCKDCKKEFVWSAIEQQFWFETCRFFVDSYATRCGECRTRRRDLHELRLEYDALIGDARCRGTLEHKERILDILQELEDAWGTLPDKMRETRETFCKQLTKDCRLLE